MDFVNLIIHDTVFYAHSCLSINLSSMHSVFSPSTGVLSCLSPLVPGPRAPLVCQRNLDSPYLHAGGYGAEGLQNCSLLRFLL
jgi:hypothetical protein